MSDEPMDAERRVDEQSRLVAMLEKGLRSNRYTVQAMPDGVEVIEVETGNLLGKVLLTAADNAEASELERVRAES